MNPFDLPGRPFLVLFVIYSVAVLSVGFIILRLLELNEPKPNTTPSDPYEVAFLRGGAAETIRIALFSLIDRGLIAIQDGADLLQTKAIYDSDSVKRRVEKALMQRLNEPQTANDITKDSFMVSACDEYQFALERQRLVPDGSIYRRRALLGVMTFIAIAWPAYIKINLALDRGHNNVGFLVQVCLVEAIVIYYFINKNRTPHGTEVLSELQEVFSGLKDRASQLPAGGQTNELSWLVAVFGMSAVDMGRFSYVPKLFPKASSSSSDGSSCGSSCGSGGCGGGGCGGGCGGCS